MTAVEFQLDNRKFHDFTQKNNSIHLKTNVVNESQNHNDLQSFFKARKRYFASLNSRKYMQIIRFNNIRISILLILMLTFSTNFVMIILTLVIFETSLLRKQIHAQSQQ